MAAGGEMDGLGFLEAVKHLYLSRGALTVPAHGCKMMNKEEENQR